MDLLSKLGKKACNAEKFFFLAWDFAKSTRWISSKHYLTIIIMMNVCLCPDTRVLWSLYSQSEKWYELDIQWYLYVRDFQLYKFGIKLVIRKYYLHSWLLIIVSSLQPKSKVISMWNFIKNGFSIWSGTVYIIKIDVLCKFLYTSQNHIVKSVKM